MDSEKKKKREIIEVIYLLNQKTIRTSRKDDGYETIGILNMDNIKETDERKNKERVLQKNKKTS